MHFRQHFADLEAKTLASFFFGCARSMEEFTRAGLTTALGEPRMGAPARLEHFDYCWLPLMAAIDLRFHGLEVETRALLHGRIVEGRHGSFATFLLDKHETPEFILEPSKVLVRAVIPLPPGRALKGIQAQVCENRRVDMDLAADPAFGLVDEAILEVVDPHRGEVWFP